MSSEKKAEFSDGTHLIVPCTSRKLAKLGKKVELSSVSARSYTELASNWFSKLEASESGSCPASQLYVGDAWNRVKKLGIFFEHKWIISAGYGFINSEAILKPYDATFSSGHTNSIPDCQYDGEMTKNLAWWEAIEKSQDNHAQVLGGVKGIIEKHNPKLLVVVASKHYLRLIQSSLEDCISKGTLKKQCLIVISSYKPPGKVGEQTVIVDGGLRDFFKCTMGALSLSAANYLLEKCVEPSADSFREIIASIPRPDKHKREVVKLSDSEVLEEIKKIVEVHGNTVSSASRALSIFRNTYGLSCEQKRFGRIFKQYKQLEAVE